MNIIDSVVNFIANFFTIIVSVIALYVYYFHRDKISTAIKLILNFSNQMTLNELKIKLDKLSDFTVDDSKQKSDIIYILNELEGQILGNKILKIQLGEPLEKIKNFTDNPKVLTEPKKRSLVHELKESIRTIDISNYNELIKSKKE
jgi:hypothetical protein